MFEHLIKRVLKKKVTSMDEVYEKMPSKGRYPANMVRLLENANLNVNLRTRRGEKIGGACGQLGRSQMQES